MYVTLKFLKKRKTIEDKFEKNVSKFSRAKKGHK